MATTKALDHIITQAKVAEWISQGKSRQYVWKRLQEEEGLKNTAIQSLYYGALRDILPGADLMADYKKEVVQQNYDRLESIIENSISGTTAADKAIAIKAIDTLNKMCGAYNDNNQVTIAKNNQGEEIIKIDFAR